MTKLFGTDGIRGLVNDKSINSEMAFKVGRALAEYSKKINRSPKIIIARDTRGSGLILEKALSAGISDNGGEAILAGIIPTPGLAFLIKNEKADAGVVISASHNDCAYNGFKIFKHDGIKLTDSGEAEIERLILKEEVQVNLGKNCSTQPENLLFREESLVKKYIDFLLNSLPSEVDFNGLKVALDCANGSTSMVAPEIFRRLGAEVELNFAQPDGKNINANCGSQHTEALQIEVKNKKAQVGLAFDGDGDRLIAVAEDGQALTGDQLIYIYSQLFLDNGWLNNNLVISTVMSNIGFINALRDLGVAHKATDVGDRAVFFEMKRSGAVLGGEESGHIIFSGLHTTGDGILSALMLVWAMNHYKKSLSELARQFTLAPKLLVNVEVKTNPELSTVAEINKVIKEVENQLGEAGRVLVRYSGTEPLCRVMVEGKDKNEVSLLTDKICQVIKKNLS